jgi:cytochrome c553
MIESRFSLGLAGFIAVAALSFSGSAVAQEAAATETHTSQPASAEEGAKKAGAVCVACHGVDGNSVNPEWPNLAGQNAAYTYEQLQLFKQKKRNNPLMTPVAETLTEQEMRDLAAYFATQTPAGLEADPSYWKAGEALYKSGDLSRNIPACTACHGPAGQGNAAAGYPALRAQHSVYTVKQLQDYLTQNRYRDPANPALVHQTRNSAMMNVIAARLTPEDIRNLASYLQGLR